MKYNWVVQSPYLQLFHNQGELVSNDIPGSSGLSDLHLDDELRSRVEEADDWFAIASSFF